MGRSERDLRETVLLFHLVSPRDRTQVLRLGDKYPHPLSYLLRPLNSSSSDRVIHTVAKGQVSGALIAKGDTVLNFQPLGLYDQLSLQSLL